MAAEISILAGLVAMLGISLQRQTSLLRHRVEKLEESES